MIWTGLDDRLMATTRTAGGTPEWSPHPRHVVGDARTAGRRQAGWNP